MDLPTTTHADMDSFLGALADCREAGGELVLCDNPFDRVLGYAHHPVEGDSVVHAITLRNAKDTPVSNEVAARFGLTPAEVMVHFRTFTGRARMVAPHS
jgi:hypothetical protein